MGTMRDTSTDTIGDTYNDASKDTSANSSNQDTFDSLRNRLKALEAENAQLKAKYASRENAMDKAQLPQPLEGESVGDRISSDLPISSSSSSLILDSPSSTSLLDQSTSSTSVLEQSLEEAESRIASLLSVKDRLVSVQEEKSRLEVDVTTLEEELETLATASRTLTACTVLPLIVLIIAIVTAFLPL